MNIKRWLLLLPCLLFFIACRPPLFDSGAGPADPLANLRPSLQSWARGGLASDEMYPYYTIQAALDREGTTLDGQMSLRLPQPWPGDEVVLRLYPNFPHYGGRMVITAARLTGQNLPVTTAAGGTVARLGLPPGDEPAGPLTVEITFIVSLPQSDRAYTLFGWRDQILSLPGFYPALAVPDERSWVVDTPPLHADALFGQAALYELFLTGPGDLTLAASGNVLSKTENGDGTQTWHVAGGPLRDLTLVLGPFQTLSEPAAGATVTAFYLEGDQAAAQAALSHAAAALRLYSDSYGPYPYTELDVVEAPLTFRGMEYSGLVLLGRDLYDAQREHLTFLAAHEVAHQWWYGLVGSNPYRHPWLDEGLAEYSAFNYYRGVFGQAAAEALLSRRWQVPYETGLRGGLAGPVDRPASFFDESNYELLVYARAALFFDALRAALGEEMFQTVLQTYVSENRYGIVTPQTLLETAEGLSGQDLGPLVTEWLR